MILILGGAYQGKLDYAKETFGLSQEDVFTCTGTEIDFTRRCIYGVEEFAYACVQAGADPIAYFAAHRAEWKDSILICRDIFCGVVPIEAEVRLWRHTTGQLCKYLAGEAEQVSRLFCGLEQRLK